MSATLYYQLPRTNRPHIPCSAPSHFGELAKKVTGTYSPWEFDRNHIERLRGMLDVGTGIDDTIEKLVQLLDSHGAVTVTAEY